MKKRCFVFAICLLACMCFTGCDIGDSHSKNYATDLYNSQKQLDELQKQDQAKKEQTNNENNEKVR